MLFDSSKYASHRRKTNAEKKHTIMIVDDEAANLSTISSMFQDKYKIIKASDGLEAYDLLTSRDPSDPVSLVISDQRMPKLSGTELFGRLLKIMPKTIRILLTGYTDVASILESINIAQIYKFVVKPFDREDLIMTVDRAIESYDLRAELEQYHINLEEKIKERTLELELKNKEILEAQRQLFQQQKMASTGVLAAGIAHELKNPLNFVNNFASLSTDLCKELDENLASIQSKLPTTNFVSLQEIISDLTQNADLIKLHGTRANRIVQSMMSLARTESGLIQPTDINDLIREFTKLALNGLQAKGYLCEVNIEYEFDPNLRIVSVMSQGLSRVILNLTTNSLESVLSKKDRLGFDYSPSILITTHLLENEFHIVVTDNGEGILPENIDHMFNPFFTTRSAGSGNIGLGLSVCYDIIAREHNGKIEVASVYGESTSVYVKIQLLPTG